MGKNPTMFEKSWVPGLGEILYCLFVRDASSRAMRRPTTVTVKAASLRRGDIVIMGVLRGNMFEVITSPAMMLPQAKRLIGFITAGLFSLIGDNDLNRGFPIETKYVRRRL